MIYYGRNRFSYVLDKRLGGGGEGEVYEIEGKSDIVAKIYFDKKFTPTADCSDPRRLLEEKINTMLDQPVDPYVAGVLSVAWPQDILYDQNRKFVGYTMPKVTSKHHIYAASRPRERKMLYPNYTWKTAVIIAYNLSLAVKNVHDKDVVIGDLNPNNIMLDEKGHVTLIDTDSFSVTNRRTGKVYKCGVGVAEMLAPELQGKDLSKSTSTFTKQTDSFALGIHIFNLLMNNCHPFGCVGMNKSQSSSSNNPIIHNITRGKCPYVTGGSGDTSPDAPDVMMLPSSIRTLFDRTFRYDVMTAVKSSTISNRPSAREWHSELYSLYSSNMKTCSVDSSHVYPSHNSSCPWCAKSSASTSTGYISTTNSSTSTGYTSSTSSSTYTSSSNSSSYPTWTFNSTSIPQYPQYVQYVWAMMGWQLQCITPGYVFSMQTMMGYIIYQVRSCLRYLGREYVIAQYQMGMMWYSSVFRVENQQMVLEQDLNVANYLARFCGMIS